MQANKISLSNSDGRDYFYQRMAETESANMSKANWANGGMFGCDFSKYNVRFTEENMQLWLTDALDSSKYDYAFSGAEYRSNDYFGYGMYVVDMKPAKADGIVSSFFIFTREDDGSNWDEIDIEFLGKDTTRVQFNFYSDGCGKHEYMYELGFDASEEFHRYGFLWLSDRIIWTVDDTPVYMVTSKDSMIPDSQGRIMMNIWNGNNSEKTINWLGQYRGSVDIHADYNYFVYTPYEGDEIDLEFQGGERISND